VDLDLQGVPQRRHSELLGKCRSKRRLRFGKQKGLLDAAPNSKALCCRHGRWHYSEWAVDLDLLGVKRGRPSELFG
jgi:hypothetical protein